MSAMIAERIMAVDGEPMSVRVFAPRLDGGIGEGAWACDYEIASPDDTLRSSAYGIDALQALTLALRIIPVFIEISEPYKQGRISWLDRQLGGADSDAFSAQGAFDMTPIGKRQ